jgi:uncharacterized protein with FMN-binding domain
MKQSQGNDKRKQKKRRLWLIPVIVVLLCVVFGLIAMIRDAPSRQELASLTIGDIDFSSLRDGTYSGSFVGVNGSRRDAMVETTVSNGTITNILVVKGAIDESGTPLDLGNGSTVYDLFESVVDKKTLQVDVISGATLTSKAHLKAFENALEQAQAPRNQN